MKCPNGCVCWEKILVAGIILFIRPANERRHYNVTSSLIGWALSPNDHWIILEMQYSAYQYYFTIKFIFPVIWIYIINIKSLCYLENENSYIGEMVFWSHVFLKQSNIFVTWHWNKRFETLFWLLMPWCSAQEHQQLQCWLTPYHASGNLQRFKIKSHLYVALNQGFIIQK